MRALAVYASENRKLGRASATYAAPASCPSSCPFLGSSDDLPACYAMWGPLGWWWKRFKSGSALAIAKEEAAAIRELRADLPLRLHTAGDAATPAAVRVLAAAAAHYRRNAPAKAPPQPVWTYTHAWRRVKRDDWGVVSCLASCEAPGGMAEAHARGYAPAIVLQREDFDSLRGRAVHRDGFRVVPCPEQTGRARSCADCRLCFRDRALHARRAAIAFRAHGARAGAVDRFVAKVG